MDKEWEQIIEDNYEPVDRLKVPGGWLYRNKIWSDEKQEFSLLQLCFIPATKGEAIIYG